MWVLLLDTKVALGSPVYIFSLFICQTVALVTENSYHIIRFFKEVFFSWSLMDPELYTLSFSFLVYIPATKK